MTKEENSLLLFLETQAVDNRGIVKTIHMNSEDIIIATNWNESGFIEFKRRKIEDIRKTDNVILNKPTHYVKLSEKAWEIVARLRKERAIRMFNPELKF